MNERQPQTPTRWRVGFAIIGVASAGIAIGAAISQVWLTAVGSSLTTVGMAGFFWSTRPRRAS